MTRAYLREQWEWIVSQAGIILLINLILLTSTPLGKTLGEIIYLDLLVLFVAGVGYSAHFSRLNKAEAKIRQMMAEAQNSDAVSFDELAVTGRNVPGIGLLKEVLEYKDRSFGRKEENYQQRMNDLRDYLTHSVHDLKVNLSVCEMVVNRLENGTEIANKLIFQIEQMKFRINQIISITRANHYSEDIRSEHVNLEQVVKEAINDNAEFLINKGISIRNDLKPYRLLSDKKWIHYIITQILNNSSKYTKQGGEITILSREDEKGYYLYLNDNGIGILAEELKRVFDKGFTGTNGRNNAKSTGMGMYYAKKMANVLGIEMTVQSKRGVYTEFILSFYKLSDYLRRQIGENDINVTQMSPQPIEPEAKRSYNESITEENKGEVE